MVTSGHSGYVAIDEVKVLGHPCSKYLSCVVKPDPLKYMCYYALINVEQKTRKMSENNVTAKSTGWVYIWSVAKLGIIVPYCL